MFSLKRILVSILCFTMIIFGFRTKLISSNSPPYEGEGSDVDEKSAPTVLILSVLGSVLVIGGTIYWFIHKKNVREMNEMLSKTKQQLDMEKAKKTIQVCFSDIIDNNERAKEDTLGIRSTAIVNSILDDDEKIKVEYLDYITQFEDASEREKIAKKFPDAFFLSGTVDKQSSGLITLVMVLYKFPENKEISRVVKTFKEIDQISFYTSELTEEIIKTIHNHQKKEKSESEKKNLSPAPLPDSKQK
ncbi:MAG: hypothetical protein JXA60_13705 [Candidatus Coatesbacteria bacterium]|nr:hypothetical protein [Candidatus Coatesbacteria bacterium]